MLLVGIEEIGGLTDLGNTTGDSAVVEDVSVVLNEVEVVGMLSLPVDV